MTSFWGFISVLGFFINCKFRNLEYLFTFVVMKINREIIIAKLQEKENILKPNQGKLSLPIINRICKKMTHNLKFRPICVSSENLIVDGHHRYISSILTNFEIELVSNYPKPGILNDFNWNTVDFLEDDWDSPAKIKMLNEEDARYNGMEIEDVESIIA